MKCRLSSLTRRVEALNWATKIDGGVFNGTFTGGVSLTPPVPKPFVHRHFRRKREVGRFKCECRRKKQVRKIPLYARGNVSSFLVVTAKKIVT